MSSAGYRYSYAGHQLWSSFALPELAECLDASGPDFRLTLSAAPTPAANVRWTHDFPGPSGECTLRCERTESGFRLHFPEIASIAATAPGEVTVYPHAGAEIESVRHVVLDQALPRLLAQRGELVLHAAAVGMHSGMRLLLIGDSGRGKSTLTGAFFASHHEVGTDDGTLVRVRDGRLVAVPTYPSLRLLPDSRQHLFAGVEWTHCPVAGHGDKRRLPIAAKMDAGPLNAIVLLAAPLPEDAPPRLVRETPTQACMAMIRHGFQLDLSDANNIKVLLSKAAEAAEMVPVYQLHFPRRYEALPEVIALLEREIR